MRLITNLSFVFTVIIFLELSTAQRAGVKKCKRQLGKVEPGRNCRKRCKNDRDCRGSKKKCHCDNVCGMSCFNKGASCPDPGSLHNGKIIGNAFTYGATIKYACDRGYLLYGQSKRDCQSDRKWSGKRPLCAEGCSRPPRLGVSYSITDGNTFRIGSVVSYKCRFGFTLTGYGTSQCLKNLTWTIPNHECIPVSCGDPGKPINGYIEEDGFTFGKWITYHCDRGYIIDDTIHVKRYCSTAGRWSGQPRTCSKLKCDQPVKPENGFVEITDSTLEYRTVIRYRCNPGYRIVGSSKGQCNEDGNWGTIPKCTVEVDCNFDSASNSFCGYSDVGTARWSRHLLRQNTVSGTPSYIIRSPSGPAVLRSPRIDSNDPHCFKFYYYVKQLRDGRSITINSMFENEELGRVHPREESFRWLSQQLTLTPTPANYIQYQIKINDWQTEIDMDEFTLETGSCVTNCFASTCLNGGTCIDRIGSFTCLCTRFYRGRNCEIEILCPALPTIKHRAIKYHPNAESLKPDTIASFRCAEGFRLVRGPARIYCTFEGTWSESRLPICKEILCSAVPSPSQGGRIVITEVPGKISIGSVVVFTCPIGMYLDEGPEIMVCNKNGIWSSRSRPRCKRKSIRKNSSSCPPSYRLYSTTCYRAFTRVMNFDQAASACSADDANLAVIRSAEERSKVKKVMVPSRHHFYGATNAGYKNMMWVIKENFTKIASERYRNIPQRQDITMNTKCGFMFKFRSSVTFLAGRCERRLRFVCQTFASDVLPVIVDIESKSERKLDGIYRPITGVTYKGSPVYKQQKESGYNLYRTKEGWAIGIFNIKYTMPVIGLYRINTNSSAHVPQDLSESWVHGTNVSDDTFSDINIRIRKYDLWDIWNGWSTCSRTCGNHGIRTRSRKCLQKGGQRGFGDCKGPYIENERCNTKKCIITRWGTWGPWSECNVPCGGGTIERSRTCIRDPMGKEFCKGRRRDSESCSTHECGPETSKWEKPAILKNEYKLFTLNTTREKPATFCSQKGGMLADANTTAVVDYLTEFLNNIHCRSKSAFSTWTLQLDLRLSENITESEYSGDGSGDGLEQQDNISRTVDVEENCRYMHHSCDGKNIWFSEIECSDNVSNRILCQRERKPCNDDPCGFRGRCENINETHYNCECHEDFHGTNCENELDGCDLSLSKLPHGNTTLDNSFEPMTMEDHYLHKGQSLYINCPVLSTLSEFTCEGRNQWQPQSIYDFCIP